MPAAKKPKSKPAAKKKPPAKTKSPARRRTGRGAGPARGPRNARISLMDRVNRAKTIAEMRAQVEPVAWGEIAKKVKLSVRQCQTIYADFLSWETVQERPMDVVRETIDVLTAVVLEASEAAKMAEQGSPAQVGALKLAAEQVVTRLAIMQAANLVPRHLGSLATTADVTEMLREFGEVLERHGASEDMLADLQALAERKLRPEQPAIEGSVAP